MNAMSGIVNYIETIRIFGIVYGYVENLSTLTLSPGGI
jgi:hypothetical protein